MRNRCGLWQLALFGKLGEEAIGIILALLHVGLIERVDRQHLARHRRRELPAHELATEVVGIAQREVDVRLIDL